MGLGESRSNPALTTQLKVAFSTPSHSKFSLAVRLVFTFIFLLGEFVALSIPVDTANLHVSTGFGGWLADWGPVGARILLLGLTLTVIFGGLMARGHALALREKRISWRASLAHLCTLPVFCIAALRLFNPQTSAASAGWLAILCVTGGLATVVSGSFILLPASFWLDLFHSARLAPVYGFATAATAFGLVTTSRWIWKPWMNLTFLAVRTLLRLLRSDIVADPYSYTIGTRSFVVTIAAACSGYEGIALMVIFGAVWLWLFRRDFRFPQSLVLIPSGMAAMWVLNVVRISALILIGNAGARAVAIGGFHSQAGWIAFLCMALAFMTVSQRVPWFAATRRETQAAPAPVVQRGDATAAYLLPFLAILAAGILSSAMTGTFEWAYGLRVVAAGAAILFYRRSYTGISWRIGWEGPAVGLVVFAIWIGAERLLFPHETPLAMPMALVISSAPLRVGWILLRTAGAVVTVPLAEELAFRGYLLRRLKSSNFASVDLRCFYFVPFVVSSLLFGILHGQRWIAGTIAGMLYAAVARRRGSLGDAAVAHATTNALIAVLVLITGNWNLW